jgi:hypothetical protein
MKSATTRSLNRTQSRPANGKVRYIENLRRIFDRHALDLVQHEDGAEILRQCGDRMLEQRSQLMPGGFRFPRYCCGLG